MKFLLVVKSKFMESLGPMILSAVIKKAGHECKIEELDEADCAMIHFQPDIVGYSIMTGDLDRFRRFNERFCKGTKLTKPFKSIVGGPDPTFNPENYDWADEICKGEGENWIDYYLLSLNGGGVREDFNMDSIPWPDRSDYPNFKVRDFVSSRGCLFKCRYCYNKRWMEMFPEQRKVRYRSPRDVVAEIKSVNPEYAFFQDSCFGADIEWMDEFTDEIGEWGDESPPYQCNLRPELITHRRVEMLSASNCVAVRMALETASDRLREMVGRKGYDCDDVRKASSLLKGAGIMFMIQNILGLPTSTIEDDLETLRLNIECKPTYSWASIYVPYVGTALGDMCKEKGYYSGDYSDISDSFFSESVLNFPPEQKEQQVCLHRIFDFCVRYRYLPEPSELTYKNIPNLIHNVMRKHGDNKLYLGLLR